MRLKICDDKFPILFFYVDDILIIGNDKEYVMDIKNWLPINFNMEDIGEADYILRVKIKRDCSKKLLYLL